MSNRGLAVIIFAFALLLGGHTGAAYIIDYQWWKEVGQTQTWWNLQIYKTAPGLVIAAIFFLFSWIAMARGFKSSATGLGQWPLVARVGTLVLLFVAAIVDSAVSDSWTIARFWGGRSLVTATEWHDPDFGLPLGFYLFDLPFYKMLLNVILALTLITAATYWISTRLAELLLQSRRGPILETDLREFNFGLESRFLRASAFFALLVIAGKFFFGRFDYLLEDHGFMVGVDYVSDYLRLPLQWAAIVACISGAILVALGRYRFAAVMVLVFVVRGVVPGVVSAVYVRPNEISLQKTYIQRHIEATRSAYGLDRRATEVEFPARMEAAIDVEANRPLFDNVRLWDWRAFHDTVSQIQPLRPYVFPNTDVDRYQIDGTLRQVLIAAREIDLAQLADARTSWINPHFIYTHGYGLVLAEANRITANGLPVLFIQNAPIEVKTKSLQVTRPEIYYGEEAHEPVFVRTARQEFNYPSGNDNVHTTYSGTGGFPISSVLMRAIASVDYGDWNFLLTGYLTPESRMMIHRRIHDRLSTIAGFIEWDSDPYLVITAEGSLVWMVDGYTTSNAHPYSRSLTLQDSGTINYIRNSVKATVDAYDGTTKLYDFDPADPLIAAYRALFPGLFLPAGAMPADLMAHTRYPQNYFHIQAEMYRTFHMRDPESFYNKADLWDFAKFTRGQNERPAPVTPTYAIATLPGEKQPEFLLMLPFTPRNKDNLIGMMAARCDGKHLGEVVFLQLSKQDLLLGPMQVEARINQDQTISKDLTLWNQQGSQVLRGQMLVLPVDNTFVYIEPIYIQASEARMPQLKKVAIGMGNTLIYRDTYDQALAELSGSAPASQTPQAPQPVQTTGASPAPATSGNPPGNLKDPRIEEIRKHLRRYRELAAQGKWAEAGKELEAVEAAAQR